MPDYKKNYKSTKGNKYKHNAEFAEEVVAKNVAHEAEKNVRGTGYQK